MSEFAGFDQITSDDLSGDETPVIRERVGGPLPPNSAASVAIHGVRLEADRFLHQRGIRYQPGTDVIELAISEGF